MLGSTEIKNHIKNSQSIDIKPRGFLEFNANDYANPYFYGTNTPPHTSGTFTAPGDTFYNQVKLSLSPKDSAQAPSNANARGFYSVLYGNKAELIQTGPGTNSWFANTPVGVKTAKFFMQLKSDYQFQAITDNTYLESFEVIISVYGIDASGKNIRSEIVTETYQINSNKWTPIEILFSNPDQYSIVDKLRINISLTAPNGKKVGLLVGQLIYSPVSEYEVFVADRLPLGQIFQPKRPGEFMIEMPAANRPNINVGDSTIPQQCSPMHMVMSYALGHKYTNVQRSVTPYPGNIYSYYVSGSDAGSKEIWSIYQKEVKANKIVLKVNAIAVKPSTFNIKILTDTGWSSNIAAGATIDEHGILILYYNGSSWNTTKWDNHLYPSISTTSDSNLGKIRLGNGPGYVKIYGISFKCTELQVSNTDFNSLPDNLKRLEVVELSPRLEIDVTKFIVQANVVKETNAENSPLFMSGISSNNATLSLSNILLTNSWPDGLNPLDTAKDIKPISYLSSSSELFKLLKRNIKVRLGFDIDINISGSPVASGKSYIPQFLGYADSILESDEQLEISAFDIVKDLQAINVRPLFIERAKISESIQSVLDSAGIGDFYQKNLNDLKTINSSDENKEDLIVDERIPYFWTNKEQSVAETLNEIFKVYQVCGYSDEYGGLKFSSFYQYQQRYNDLVRVNTTSPDLYVQDFSNSNSKSNLINASVEQNLIPRSLIVQHITPSPSMTQPYAREKETDDEKEEKANKKIYLKQGTSRVWNLEEEGTILPYIRISKEGIKDAVQDYIPYEPKLTETLITSLPYSSMLLIDSEILSYDGIQYEFAYRAQTDPEDQFTKINKTIKSPDEIPLIQAELFYAFNAVEVLIPQQTGRLMNVKRGLFGTTAERHMRTSMADSGTRWKTYSYILSNNVYSGSAITGSEVVSPGDGFIAINHARNDRMIFLYPSNNTDDSDIVKKKKRLSAMFKINKVPVDKEGHLGVGVGLVTDNTGKLKEGLLIWAGIEPGKRQTEPVIHVQQVINGEVKTIISKTDFQYARDFLDIGENIEFYVALNEKKNKCKIYVGGASAFRKEIKEKKEGEKKKKKRVVELFDIKPLSGQSQFGVIAKGNVSFQMFQYLFGETGRPSDLNDLEINNLDDDYQTLSDGATNDVFFIGPNNLLDTIVDGRLISGISSSRRDNFVYTGSPVGRGLKIFEVDYEQYPVINRVLPRWTGYTYNSAIFDKAQIILGQGEPPPEGSL